MWVGFEMIVASLARIIDMHVPTLSLTFGDFVKWLREFGVVGDWSFFGYCVLFVWVAVVLRKKSVFRSGS